MPGPSGVGPAACLLLALAAWAAGDEPGGPDSGAADDPPPVVQVVPSPSTVSGLRRWPAPAFSHWPAVMFIDEQRHAALSIPVRTPGATGSLGWEGGAAAQPFALPADAEAVGALIALPPWTGPGERTLRAEVAIADEPVRLPLRLVPASAPWPLAGLRGGFPVDRAGAPVVLVDRRFDASAARRWAVARGAAPRPDGRALLVGDPLRALGASAWDGVDAEQRPAAAPPHPHHAALVALAELPRPLPRTIVWSPGNQGCDDGVGDPEEVRLMSALASRLDALGQRPRLVLALPPEPLSAKARSLHPGRRQALARMALTLGWEVVDLARIAGPAEQANRIAPGAYAPYPIGEARARMAAALAAAIN